MTDALPAIRATGVIKRFGKTTALHGIDVTVRPGQIVGLLGPNGSGKSTFAKITCGLVRPSGGQTEVFGAPAGSRAARRRVGYLAELFQFPPWLTGDELLTFHQRLAGSRGGAAERRTLLESVELTKAADRRLGGYSKGMQQRLGLAQALIGGPDLLLLDEPTSALDPVARRVVRDVLLATRDRGASILLSSHLLTEVQDLADRVVLILNGRVIRDESMATLTQAAGVVIVTDEGEQTYVEAAREDVPALVARLVGEGRQVFEVRPNATTLESAYLDAVQGASS